MHLRKDMDIDINNVRVPVRAPHHKDPRSTEEMRKLIDRSVFVPNMILSYVILN